MPSHLQDEIQAQSLKDPDAFWSHQAKQVTWSKDPREICRQSTKKLSSGASYPTWEWFPEGEINLCYNCIDRHIEAGHGGNTAIIWDSPVTGFKEKYTYQQVLDEVNALASVLKDQAGLGKGDTAVIYSMHIVLTLTRVWYTKL